MLYAKSLEGSDRQVYFTIQWTTAQPAIYFIFRHDKHNKSDLINKFFPGDIDIVFPVSLNF